MAGLRKTKREFVYVTCRIGRRVKSPEELAVQARLNLLDLFIGDRVAF